MAKKSVKKNGRPTIYNEKIAKEICDAVARHGLGLDDICAMYPHLPNPDTIYVWKRKHPIFAEMYTQAKRNQVEVMVEDVLKIADNSAKDVQYDSEGNKIVDYEHINRSRLRVDTRKWLAAKLAPRIYGERVLGDPDKDGHITPEDYQKYFDSLPISQKMKILEKFLDEIKGLGNERIDKA